MARYCCVKGCSNNSNHKKKYAATTVSFHAFPSNPELRLKWLRAIGRPNWTPPTHARICSIHFDFDQICQEGVRTRIMEDACPVNALPLNSNFEASQVELCRICLAGDVKMYDLQTGSLKTFMESIAGFNENLSIEGLPQYICYECAAQLMKCYQIVEKSVVAQATLLDIFLQHGQITKRLVKMECRKVLKLSSSLQSHNVTPGQLYVFEYDEIENVSYLKSDDIYKEETEAYESKLETKTFEFDVLTEDVATESGPKQCKVESVDEKCENVGGDPEDEGMIHEDDLRMKYGDIFVLEQVAEVFQAPELKREKPKRKSRNKSTDKTKRKKLDEESSDLIIKQEQFNIDVHHRQITEQQSESEHQTIIPENQFVRRKRKKLTDYSLDEASMQEYFNIITLTPKEQIEDWQKCVNRRSKGKDFRFKCETCLKMFANHSAFKRHVTRHESSRGKAECAVCKLRFRSDIYARWHARYTHEKKFQCKTCSKVFNGVPLAKKHQLWHAGQLYRCAQCAWGGACAGALAAHERARHALCACAACGRHFATSAGLRLHEAGVHAAPAEPEKSEKYKCEECDIVFASEVARHVHLLSSSQHKKQPELFINPPPEDPALRNSCKRCGLQFTSTAELVAHLKSEHPKKKRTSWAPLDDCYPKQCEYCEVTMNSRKVHWAHIRRQHPKQRTSYKPVITVICDTCGKGFQNKTKLGLHELRHRSPTVRCALCPKLFYDKFQAAMHLTIHGDTRPHRCATCGRGFKLRGNLERHYKVHTDVATYECTLCDKKFKYSTSLNLHVRTVHYKLPHPPRKKRSRNKNNTDSNSDNIM